METRTGMFIIAGIVIAIVIGLTVSGITGNAYVADKYKYFSWDCQDGTQFNQTGCRTYNAWLNHATSVCASHCRREESNNARICNPGNFHASVRCKTPWTFRLGR